MTAKRIRSLLYPRIAATVAGILLLCAILVLTLSRNFVREQSVSNLREISTILDNILHDQRYTGSTADFSLQEIVGDIAKESSTRITYIFPDGTVIADSQEDPVYMDNHRTRPEVLRALSGIPASVIRYSDTLEIDMLYYAVPVSSDTSGDIEAILRVAVPFREMRNTFSVVVWYLVIGSIFFIVLSILLILFIDKRIEKPLIQLSEEAGRYQKLQFEALQPIQTPSVEIQTLGRSLRVMARELEQTIAAITDQKIEIQSILDSMDNAMLVLNSHGRIIRSNPAAERMFSAESPEALLSQYYMRIVQNTALNAILEPVIRAANPYDDLTSRKFDFTYNDRQYQVYLSIIGNSPERNILIVFNDITRLLHLEKVRSDFVANVSHELKTPVTSIKGFTETLLDQDIKPDDDSFKRFLTIIHAQTDRLQAIIEDLLTLSMLEQDDDIDDLQLVNVQSLIRDSVAVCVERPRFSERTVQINCSDSLQLRCNPLLIEQAIINLVDNALKYSDPSTEVEVSCHASGHSLAISVRDHGFGIPEELQARIFERFFRIDKGRSREKGGTGLGLSIVRHIAMKHNGTVYLESSENSGSTFTISLPQGPQF